MPLWGVLAPSVTEAARRDEISSLDSLMSCSVRNPEIATSQSWFLRRVNLDLCFSVQQRMAPQEKEEKD